MVIINLRGTGGSGKSTVVRRVMAACKGRQEIFEEGRRRPKAYLLPVPGGQLFIPGHYETACGGCDTIKTPDQVYHHIREAVFNGWHVLYEGIIVQDDKKRLLELNAQHPVTVIELSTPIEECLAGIQARRDERGDERPLNPKNTVGRAKRVHATCEALRAEGVTVSYLSREDAFQQCMVMLGMR